VGHADEHFERLRDVLAGRRLGEFPDEADAARVAIISRVEEALRLSHGVGGDGGGGGVSGRVLGTARSLACAMTAETG
jgi:hypothetical protein